MQGQQSYITTAQRLLQGTNCRISPNAQPPSYKIHEITHHEIWLLKNYLEQIIADMLDEVE